MSHDRDSPPCPDVLVSLAVFLSQEVRRAPAGTSAPAIHQRLATLAVEWVPGAERASVSTRPDGAWATTASTSPRAVAVDAAQYGTGSGPCLDAIASGGACSAPDLRSDPRWPLLRQRMDDDEIGSASVLSVPVPTRGAAPRASLNLYSDHPQAFGATAFTAATFLSVHAGLLLDGVAVRREITRLNRALEP